MDNVLVVFTYRSIEQLVAEGGTQSWRLDPARARQCTYVVCTRNLGHPDASREEAHGEAFLVARISDVSVAPERSDRYIVNFAEYALLTNHPNVWSGQRSPVAYVKDLATLEISYDELSWTPMPQGRAPSGVSSPGASKRTVDELRALVATENGVSVDRVEIVIRL
jgi:hypothetical protein